MLPQRAADFRASNLFLREIENTKLLQHPNLVKLRILASLTVLSFHSRLL
jgi:hypothetical protein